MSPDPFAIQVYTKDLQPLYSLPLSTGPSRPGVTSVAVKPSLAENGVATITMPLTHERAVDMLEMGRRVRIWDRFGGHLLSGPIIRSEAERGSERRGASTVTFTIEDDRRLLHRTLGWVAPGAAITAQQSGNSDAAYKISGPAETVVKTLAAANIRDPAARPKAPLYITPDRGRGSRISVAIRNAPLADKLYPQVTQAGVGIVVRQEDVGEDPRVQRIALDVSEFVTHPQILTAESPQVVDWSFQITGPEALWGVAGGQGEGDARVFRQAVNAAELDEWGVFYGGEFFDDQRQESNPDSVQAALDAELAAKASRVSVGLTLDGSGPWAYGRAWRVGDWVRVRLVPGREVQTLQITSAELAWSVEAPYSATTTVGETRAMDLVTNLKRMSRQLRDLRASR